MIITFNTRASLHENQRPRFGGNDIISKQRKRFQLSRVLSVIAENKSHAHHKAHLHTMKAVSILTISPRNAWENGPLFATGYTLAFLESHSAKASSTNHLLKMIYPSVSLFQILGFFGWAQRRFQCP